MTSSPVMSRFRDQQIPERLRTELELHDDTVVVVAAGEIDLESANGLREQLSDLLRGCRALVLDLREVVFIDSSGLHCILEIADGSAAAGVEFALVRGPRPVQRLFELTRTDGVLRFVDPGVALDVPRPPE